MNDNPSSPDTTGNVKRIASLEKRVNALERKVLSIKSTNRYHAKRVEVALEQLRKALPHVPFPVVEPPADEEPYEEEEIDG